MTARVLVPPGADAHPGARLILDESEVHHLQVRRAREGETVEVRDGFGLVATGRLMRQGKTWMVELGEGQFWGHPPELVLAVGAGDRERFDWLVEKATELGVTAIVPLETERTAGVGSRLRGAHIEKLRRRALEAIKQCGAPWAPRIEPGVALAELIAQARSGVRWVADLAGQPPTPIPQGAAVTVVVGPEGGFTSEERTRLIEAGYQPTALASQTLRFETAAVAAAAAVATSRLRGAHG